MGVDAARSREFGRIQFDREQLFVRTGAYEVGAARCHRAGQAAVREAGLRTTAVDVGEEQLTLVRPGRDDMSCDDLERSHQTGRDDQPLCSGVGVRSHSFREFDVVAGEKTAT